MEALQADPAVLLALAARCEEASDGDRELDAEIAAAVRGGEIVWRQANFTMDHYPTRRYPSRDHVSGFGVGPVEKYTASIDAALTLVPEGYFVHRIGQYADMSMWGVIIFRQSDLGLQFPLYGEATSGARSAGAAALRARAHLSAQRPSTPSSDHPNP